MTEQNSDTPDSRQKAAVDKRTNNSAVRFNEGPLKGFEGIIVDRRESGRYLIQLRQGVYVEANLVEFSPGEAS